MISSRLRPQQLRGLFSPSTIQMQINTFLRVVRKSLG